jgi:hypothetical protein
MLIRGSDFDISLKKMTIDGLLGSRKKQEWKESKEESWNKRS